MKAVIFAGGFGTRLSEATNLIPKPMVEIGGKPILWHIMKTYSHYGINEFVICCGYKQYVIKEYFANYFRHNSDLTVDLSNNSVEILDNHSENWKVTMVDTGLNTQTGGRLKQVQKYIGDERFVLTYGDGVADINIAESIKEHELSGCDISLTAYNPNHFRSKFMKPDRKPATFKTCVSSYKNTLPSIKIFKYIYIHYLPNFPRSYPLIPHFIEFHIIT